MIIDESTEFGARVAAHLREEIVVWLTSVSPSGTPLPMPVWFLWEGGESVVMFSRDGARVRNLEANANVSLNFAGDGRGGDIVVLSGRRDRRSRRPAREPRPAHTSRSTPTTSGASGTRPTRSPTPTRCPCGSRSSGCAGTDHSPGGGPGQAQVGEDLRLGDVDVHRCSFQTSHSAVSATASVARVQNT